MALVFAWVDFPTVQASGDGNDGNCWKQLATAGGPLFMFLHWQFLFSLMRVCVTHFFLLPWKVSLQVKLWRSQFFAILYITKSRELSCTIWQRSLCLEFVFLLRKSSCLTKPNDCFTAVTFFSFVRDSSSSAVFI